MRSVHAIAGVDLTVRPGEIVALPRPQRRRQDHARSTCVLGLSRGRHRIGLGVRHGPERGDRHGLVSAVMQNGGLLPDLTVARDRPSPRACSPPPRPVDEVLERAGITDIGERKVEKCSGGQQQRLRFAMALVLRPDAGDPRRAHHGHGRRGPPRLLVLDPADAERGRTILFATHYLEEADEYADRIVLMQHGRIVADGTSSEIKNLASGRTVRATLADPDPPPARPDPGRRLGRGARRLGAGAHQRLRRGRPLAADRDRGPRPRDHLAQPRAGVHRPDVRPARARPTVRAPTVGADD